MASRIIPVDTFDLVIFGGTGDLARRKILPGLFRRFCASQIPTESRIVGVARSHLEKKDYQLLARDSITEFSENRVINTEYLAKFLEMLDYIKVDARGEDGWVELGELVRKDVVNAYYLSVGPDLFGEIASRLNKWNIATPKSRVVIEKPFGHDLSSAKKLNKSIISNNFRACILVGEEIVLCRLNLKFSHSFRRAIVTMYKSSFRREHCILNLFLCPLYAKYCKGY